MIVDEHSGTRGVEETFIRVKGMQCFYCFTIAADIFKKYEGVKEVKVGLDSGEAKVVYCADQINSS
jgi:copper chaperone CopZ